MLFSLPVSNARPVLKIKVGEFANSVDHNEMPHLELAPMVIKLFHAQLG